MTVLDSETRIDPEEIRETAQRFLANKVERRAAWEGKDAGCAALEAEMAELGWYLLIVPEAQGGLGQSFEALAPIYEEMGRALAPSWLAGTMAAIDVLATGGHAEALSDLVGQGWRIATIVLPAGQTPDHAQVRIVGGADRATHLLLIAADGSAARLIPADAVGVSLVPVETWDRGRAYAALSVEGEQGSLAVDGSLALAVAQAHGDLALAWDSIGAASQCLSETIDYMLGRQQFGRPIASFQALKHRAADHKVALELARALARHASSAFARRSEGWAVLAAQSRILAVEAFRAIGEDAVQMHGGVGFTWEYNCHLFLKRALVNEVMDGTPDQIRDRIAAQVAAQAMG
ncbi:acyl-CoA dehydrogenase family protein [Novosphingobium rosa]|uniref:acyl-CoA dehydrogenase family protein n=1 Tax=Novosphingobium rosa TaxID=76978 RepID=UPI0008333CB6|nr:acyl-CoA dehydrogenase family protein [Novosphingobium rosa]